MDVKPMREELVAKLRANHPTLFGPADKGATNNVFGHWGFQCGDGWYQILDTLATQIEATCEDVVVTQIKEKFGALRVYTTGVSDKVDALIREAEQKSTETCERCGAPGKIRDDTGWLYTACYAHVAPKAPRKKSTKVKLKRHVNR